MAVRRRLEGCHETRVLHHEIGIRGVLLCVNLAPFADELVSRWWEES